MVRFCQDYLVGRRKIKDVQFGGVHKMEQRFARDAPIAARFSLSPVHVALPDTDKYNPLPYVPQLPKRRLPIHKVKKTNVNTTTGPSDPQSSVRVIVK